MMNYYDGMLFFLFLLPVLAGALIIGYFQKPLRWYILTVSLLAALIIFGARPQEGLWLLLFLGWTLGLCRWYLHQRIKGGRNSGVFHLALVLILLPLILCKISPLGGWSLFGFTGVSYLSFRTAQILIETYDGLIQELPFARTLCFLLFFPSVSSGPIDRSRRFDRDWERTLTREDYLELAGKGLLYLFWGLVYKMILAAWAYKGMGYLDAPDARWFHWIGYALAYSLYLFFDFAGYSRMAVGSAMILGVELPDNFNAPFLAGDIRQFWDRWHITLSHWFRDFIFTRFIMACTRRKWFRNRLNRACAGFIVNMAVMGLWHGISLSYVLYGFYHGILLAGTEYFQKKSGFYRKNRDRKWFQILSWAVTMILVVCGFFLFSGKPVELLQRSLDIQAFS